MHRFLETQRKKSFSTMQFMLGFIQLEINVIFITGRWIYLVLIKICSYICFSLLEIVKP